jgi:hypothetical protein
MFGLPEILSPVLFHSYFRARLSHNRTAATVDTHCRDSRTLVSAAFVRFLPFISPLISHVTLSIINITSISFSICKACYADI